MVFENNFLKLLFDILLNKNKFENLKYFLFIFYIFKYILKIIFIYSIIWLFVKAILKKQVKITKKN